MPNFFVTFDESKKICAEKATDSQWKLKLYSTLDINTVHEIWREYSDRTSTKRARYSGGIYLARGKAHAKVNDNE